jgi:UDP-perosamine 4-acetyltransferase
MRTRVALIGAGGHAKVIIDILRTDDSVEIIGCVSPNPGQVAVLGVPILGGDEIIPELFRDGVKSAFIAIGDNPTRVRFLRHLKELGFGIVNAVSPAAIISTSATLGRGVAVMPGAIINTGSAIADGAIVNTGAVVDHDCRIGTGAHIAPGVSLAGNVTVGDGAFLGVGSSVIPGISIGSWTTVGAGAVVVRDLPEHVLAFGVPARVQRYLDP